MAKQLHWGILGTGNIAQQFADGVLTCRRGILAAVASRDHDRALEFAQARNIPTAHGRYEDLLCDDHIDAIYLSLPNALHHEWTIKALAAGKHVLCEKPIALDHAQAKEMFDAARQHQRVLVEAFMYRAHPLTHAVVEAVRAGEIGQLRLIRTSFCYCMTRTENIRYDRALGGGGLMDVGCYCINFSRLFAGEDPNEVQASAHIHERGVDDVAAGSMRFPGGIVASFTCGMSVHADNTAYLCGTEGYIEIPIPWKPPSEQAQYVIAHSTPPRMDRTGKMAPPREVRQVDAKMHLYAIEADAFAEVVLDGRTPFVSESDTLGNMAVLDEMRRQIGLAFT